jgi:hypothetical protein
MKVFGIYNVKGPLTPEQRRDHLPQEVPATLKLYLDGKIEQFWFREKGGPIFLFNVDTVDQAKTAMESLPLVAKGLASFDLWPVGPLMPLGLLLQEK